MSPVRTALAIAAVAGALVSTAHSARPASHVPARVGAAELLARGAASR
jgi:hypothetical protein